MNEYSDFKPVDRSRAYTWHGSHSGIEEGQNASSKFTTPVQTCNVDGGSSSVGSSSKKPWSRRNAWGSMSYADLIGKAIESTADKRMTLSQIYDWMVQNVPYFHDKGTGSSSTGWKVWTVFFNIPWGVCDIFGAGSSFVTVIIKPCVLAEHKPARWHSWCYQ